MRSIAAPWWSQPTEWAAPSTDWPAGALVLPIDCPLSGGTYTVQPWGACANAAVGPDANVPGFVGIDFASPITITGNFTWVVVARAEFVSVAGVSTFGLERTGALGTVEFALAAGRANVVLDNNVGTILTGDYTVPTVFVFTRVGNQIRSYVAGEFKGTAVTGTRTGAVTGLNFGRSRTALNNPGRTIGELQAVFPVALSDDDIRVLSTNVWQLFAGTMLGVPGAVVGPVNPTAPGGRLAMRGNAPAAAQTHKATAPGGRLFARGNAPTAIQTHKAAVLGGRLLLRGAAPAATQTHKALAPGGRLTLRGDAPAATGSGALVAPPGRMAMRGNAPAAVQTHKATAPGGRLVMRGAAPSATQTHKATVRGAALALRGNAPAAQSSGAVVAARGRLAMRGNAPAVVQTQKARAPGGRLAMRGNAPAVLPGSGLGEICDHRLVVWQDACALTVWQDDYSPIICGTFS